MTDYTDRILDVYRLSSDTERVDGAGWYREVNHFARALARRYSLPLEIPAGMLAVMSPRISWRLACQTVTRMLAAYDAGLAVDYLPWPGLKINIEKAIGILYTGDCARYVTGDKVRSFYDNILNGTESDHVTVDVWAWRVIAGRGATARSFNTDQYNEIAESYRRAASQVNLPPCQLQAITWLTAQRLEKYPAEQLTLF